MMNCLRLRCVHAVAITTGAVCLLFPPIAIAQVPLDAIAITSNDTGDSDRFVGIGPVSLNDSGGVLAYLVHHYNSADRHALFTYVNTPARTMYARVGETCSSSHVQVRDFDYAGGIWWTSCESCPNETGARQYTSIGAEYPFYTRNGDVAALLGMQYISSSECPPPSLHPWATAIVGSSLWNFSNDVTVYPWCGANLAAANRHAVGLRKLGDYGSPSVQYFNVYADSRVAPVIGEGGASPMPECVYITTNTGSVHTRLYVTSHAICLAELASAPSPDEFSIIFTAIATTCSGDVEKGFGIYRRTLTAGSPAATVRLVEVGTDATTAECFESFEPQTVSTNRHQEIAVYGLRCGDSEEGIWTGDAGTLIPRVRVGDTADCGGTFTHIRHSFQPIPLNSTGDVVFRARVVEDTVGYEGLFRSYIDGSGSHVECVAREGTPLRQLASTTTPIRDIGPDIAVNESGQVAFVAIFEDYSQSLVVFSPETGISAQGYQEIARTGDPVNSPDDSDEDSSIQQPGSYQAVIHPGNWSGSAVKGGGDDGRLRWFGDDGWATFMVWLESGAQAAIYAGPRELYCEDIPQCPSDFNSDGGVDGADVEAFETAYEEALCSADVNGDGGIDGADVEAFYELYYTGASGRCCR